MVKVGGYGRKKSIFNLMCCSLTVQKEGPNKGRQFYACPAPRGEGCNFFQWGDEQPGDGGFNSGIQIFSAEMLC